MTVEDKALLQRVDVAWPTVALAVVVVGTWGASTALALSGDLPMALAAAINFAAAFAAFTVMHDASHRSVGSSRLLNEVLGRVAAVLLTAPFTAFRWVHLEHHKHTNHPDKDPDFWSGKGPSWMLPLRWLTQDLHYYVLYFEALGRRPRRERIETLVTFTAIYAVAITAALSGLLVPVIMLWLLPARLATAMLALSFDYLPHRPHRVTAREDRFRATHILTDAWLTPLFLYQNYHLIHHLYPGVPFYRYARIFVAKRQELQANGARIERLVGGRLKSNRGTGSLERV
jgi:fatty acid desaturase